MNNSGHMEELIEAYLADGLSGKEKVEFERHCAGCESCRKALEEARAFEAKAFSALEPDRAPADLEERVISAFQRGARNPSPQPGFKGHARSPFSLRFLRLVAIPIAAVLLICVGIAVMTPRLMSTKLVDTLARYGDNFTPPSSIPPEAVWKDSEGADHNEENAWQKDKGDSYDFFSDKPLKGAGVFDMMGVGAGAGGAHVNPPGSRTEEASKGPRGEMRKFPAETSPARPSVPTSGGGEPLNPNRKIIKSGKLTFEVDSFEAAYQKLVGILTEEKGYIASSSTTKLPNGKIRGEIIIRVPPEKFDTITLKLRGLGELKNQSVTSEDITKQYFDLQARLKNAKVLEEHILKLMAHKKAEMKDLLELEKELAVVREKIEQMQGEIRYYDNLVSFATISLEIYEKDIGAPFEYVQTQSGNLTIAVADVPTSYNRAQKMVHDLKGQIVKAQLLDQDKRARGLVQAYVDAEQFTIIWEQLKELGEVKSAEMQQRQTPPEGTSTTRPENTPVRKERGLITVALNPPAGEYVQTQKAHIRVEVSDVETAYTNAQDIITKSQAKILNGNLNKGVDRTVATVTCQVEADRFRLLVDSLKTVGKVKSSTMDEQQQAVGIDPKSTLPAPVRKEPSTIYLSISSPQPIIAEATGAGATIIKSLGGLLWSLHMLVVGILTIAPWVVILILVIFLMKRWVFKKPAVKS